MKLHPRVSRSGLELVKRFEGLRRRAARLPDGGWTLGYGHVRSAREGAVVSPEDAEALLYYDLSEVAEKVEAWTFTPLNQNQFEALTAFAFNIGADNFRRSTVLKRVNEGQHLAAAAALELWRKSNFDGEDIVVDALVRRRAAEKAHYLTPPDGHRPSPTPVLKPAFDHSVIEAAAAARAGRSATVIDAPLYGDRACAEIEAESEASDHRPTIDPVKAFADTGVVAAPLHQFHPERAGTDTTAPVWGTNAFGVAGDDEPDRAEASSLKDAPFGHYVAPSRTLEASTDFPLFAGVVPQPASILEAPAEPSVGEPVRSIFLVGGTEAPHRVNDPPSAPQDNFDEDVAPAQSRSRTWPTILLCTGILGVMLVAVALFTLLGGKADLANLMIGLTGILLIIAAGGCFLLRSLKKGDDFIEA